LIDHHLIHSVAQEIKITKFSDCQCAPDLVIRLYICQLIPICQLILYESTHKPCIKHADDPSLMSARENVYPVSVAHARNSWLIDQGNMLFLGMRGQVLSEAAKYIYGVLVRTLHVTVIYLCISE